MVEQITAEYGGAISEVRGLGFFGKHTDSAVKIAAVHTRPRIDQEADGEFAQVEVFILDDANRR